MINLRKKVIRGLIDPPVNDLLDVGSGPIFPDYAYADRAERVTCTDWKPVAIGKIAPNVTIVPGDFAAMNWAPDSFDAIVAADVFEHVAVESEARFAANCIATLRPGGRLIVSVPHRGSFAWLDPYEVKPLAHRMLARAGLYKKTHNGGCDIRKGHKHYKVTEIAAAFAPLTVERVIYWGYVYDPLLTWAYALLGERSTALPVRWLETQTRREFERDFGERSFNMAVVMRKA